MAKATPADLIAEGFSLKNFGLNPNDMAAWTTYLQDVLDEAGAWTKSYIADPLYSQTLTPAYAFYSLRRADLCKASEILWRRRVAFLDGGASIQNQSGEFLERREMQAHARSATECALSNLTEAMQALGLDPLATLGGSCTSTGFIETGRYPRTSTGAIND